MFCVNLSLLCNEYGKAPHEYLCNSLIDCAHTKLAIDMAVFEIYCVHEEKERKAKERRAKVRG